MLNCVGATFTWTDVQVESIVGRMYDNATYTRKSGGAISKIANALLRLIRHITMSYLVEIPSRNERRLMIENVTSGAVMSYICSFLRLGRDIEQRTSPASQRTVNAIGDISVNNFTVLKNQWSQMIPKSNEIVDNIFMKVFSDPFYQEVLDLSNEILLWRILRKFSFHVKSTPLLFTTWWIGTKLKSDTSEYNADMKQLYDFMRCSFV